LPQVALFDTRGWTADSASGELQLLMLLSGLLQAGADLTQPIDAEALKAAVKSSGRSKTMHVVAVVVPSDVSAETLALLKRSCETVRRFDVRTVLVVTRVDRCGDTAVAASAAKVATSGAVRKVVSDLAAATGVPASSVVAVQNLATSADMDWAAAALVWKAMETIIARALDTLEAAQQSSAAQSAATVSGGGEEMLSAALVRVVGAANQSKVDKWATLLSAQDLDTVGDVRLVTAEAFARMADQPWCTVALHSALISLRQS
jgi:hypothetical protein